MLFFFPQFHGEIHWTRRPEFLDQELQQVMRDASLGKRLVDKLVKIYRLDGEESWILIHVEVQAQQESDFARRIIVIITAFLTVIIPRWLQLRYWGMRVLIGVWIKAQVWGISNGFATGD